MKQKLTTQSLATMGLLIAMIVVLSRVLGIETTFLKISFQFVPEMIMGMLFGPFWTAIGASVADVIGMAILAKAPYFVGFTINAAIGGALYGWFFYQKEVTLSRAFLVTLLNTLLITLALTPLWLHLMYQMPLNWAFWSLRLAKAVIFLPVQTGLIYATGKALPHCRIRATLARRRPTPSLPCSFWSGFALKLCRFQS